MKNKERKIANMFFKKKVDKQKIERRERDRGKKGKGARLTIPGEYI